MVKQRGAREVVTRGSISEPLCGITSQTDEAASEQKSGHSSTRCSTILYCSSDEPVKRALCTIIVQSHDPSSRLAH